MTDLQEKGGELELNIEMTYWKNQHNESIDTIKVIISESQYSRAYMRWSRSKQCKYYSQVSTIVQTIASASVYL